MGRIPRTSKPSEETSYFATPSYHSYEDKLHALKLKTHHAEPSSLWHATKRLPTAFVDLFRQRTPTSPAKAPLHRSQPLRKAFSWPSLPSLGTLLTSLGTLLKYCSYALAAVLFILMAGAMISFVKFVIHEVHVCQANNTHWYAMDRQWEARRELNAAVKQHKASNTMESFMNTATAQRNFEEARDKAEEIKAALMAEGIYFEFCTVSWEEYEALRSSMSPEQIAFGRWLMEYQFPCTPSRTAELNDHQQKKEEGMGEGREGGGGAVVPCPFTQLLRVWEDERHVRPA